MKLLIGFAIALLLSSLVNGHNYSSRINPDGTEWVGGGGILENEFMMTWQRRGEWAKPCLSEFNACQLETDEFNLLNSIYTTLNGPDLQFRSFKSHPELNVLRLGLDGQIGSTLGLVATKMQLNSQIFVDTDKLYENGSNPLLFRGIQRPLLHLYSALLYQTGLNLKSAVTISEKVSNFWSHTEMILHLGTIDHVELGVTYFQSATPTIFINDSNGLHNITSWFQKSLPCDNETQIPQLLKVQNTYWHNVATEDSTKKSSIINSTLKGNITYKCSAEAKRIYTAEFSLKLIFKSIPQSPNHFEIQLNQNKINFYYRELELL